MFNYKQLMSFTTVVEEGSFSKAAKKLFITQPAISSQIKNLEHELGVLLIERSERGVILTEAGEILYNNSRIIINQYQVLHDSIKQYKCTDRGSLRIASSTIPGEYLLPKYIQSFKKETPHVNVYLDICDSKTVLNRVMNGEATIGIIGSQPKENEVKSTPFINEKIKLICAKNSEYKEKISMDNILAAPHIVREEGSGTRSVIFNHLSKMGLNTDNMNVQYVLGSTQSILTAIEEDLGIGWVSENALTNALSLHKIETLNDMYDIERSFYIITPMNRTLKPLDEAFVNHLTLSC